MRENHEDTKDVLERAERAFEIGRWADALEGYEAVLAADSGLVVARAQAGRCRLRLGREPEAVEDLEEAIAQAEVPEVVWWVELGEAYMGQGRDDQAADSFQTALKHDPNRADAYACMGVLYIRRRAYNMARTVLERAVALEYSLAIAHHNLAIVYCYLGDFKKAADELTIALNLGQPIDPAFREMLTQQLIRINQTQRESS